MSQSRPPSSRSPERKPSSRREYESYGETDNRRSAPGPSSRSSSSRSGRDTASGSSRSSSGSSRPQSSSRSGSERQAATQRSGGSSPRSGSQGGRSTRTSGQRSGRSAHKRSSSILPVLALMAFGLVLLLILRFFFFSGDGKANGPLSLEFSSKTLAVGETATVTVVGLPEDYKGIITWSSSDTEVVKVNKGSLTAKKVGTATIAASVEGENITATVQVTETPQGVKSLTLNKSAVSILSGETHQLKASIVMEHEEEAPNIPIIWSSSNMAVARVSSDGLISARDVGSASITATVGNQSAVCVVTVEKNPNSQPADQTEGTEADSPEEDGSQTGDANKPDGTAATNSSNKGSTATSLSMSQTKAYLNVGETMVLEAAVTPSGAALSWSSNNTSLADIGSGGLVTAKAPGTVVITVKSGSLNASCSIEIAAEGDSDTAEE